MSNDEIVKEIKKKTNDVNLCLLFKLVTCVIRLKASCMEEPQN